MVEMGPTRRQATPASASLASSRESTPEHGRITPSVGGGKDEDDLTYEGKSITLRDILVRAGDATFAHFDILRERYLSFSLFFSSAQAAQALKEVHTSKKNISHGLIVLCARLLGHAKVARLLSVLDGNPCRRRHPAYPTRVAAGTPRVSLFCLTVIAD